VRPLVTGVPIMTRRSLCTRMALAALVVSGLLLTCRGAVADQSCVTGKCHATLLQGQSVHPIAESCSTCHESTGTPHPQKGQRTFKLTQELPDLCTTCHPTIADGRHVHFPVAQGLLHGLPQSACGE
jgi:hypothetical protein